MSIVAEQVPARHRRGHSRPHSHVCRRGHDLGSQDSGGDLPDVAAGPAARGGLNPARLPGSTAGRGRGHEHLWVVAV